MREEPRPPQDTLLLPKFPDDRIRDGKCAGKSLMSSLFYTYTPWEEKNDVKYRIYHTKLSTHALPLNARAHNPAHTSPTASYVNMYR